MERDISIEIETDEDGFWLYVRDSDGKREAYPIADPEALYDHVKGAIGPWLRERDEAAAIFWKSGRFVCDPDESGGYDQSDPKHPDHHSVHADIYDQRAGK